MDSRHLFRYILSSGTDLSPTSGLPSGVATAFPSGWSGYHHQHPVIKAELGRSPSSPLSSQFDRDSLSVNQDLAAYTEAALSGRSASNNSSLDTDDSSKHSPTYPQEREPVQAPRPPPVAAASAQTQRHALLEIESLLMSPETEEAQAACAYPEFGGVPRQIDRQKTRARSWMADGSLEESPSPSSYAAKYQTAANSPSPSPSQSQGQSPRAEKRLREAMPSPIPRADIKTLLVACASAISDGRLEDFEQLRKQTESSVSISGEPVQRLGAYMLEGLRARREASGNMIYRSLKCKEPAGRDLLSYMQILYEICPYFKFGYMAANGAIAEAVRKEDRIHIIDFQIAQGTQWITLIQALAQRPGGPPHVRITGIDDPVSKFARGDSLQAVGKRLEAMSEKFKIPLEFHAVPVYADEVTKEMLGIRPGETLAVNFTLHLHHTPDESVDVNNPRDGLLRMVKGMSPKVVTLVEQESNTNTTPFLTRFMETFEYYHAMFESMDETLGRDNKDRINVEMNCLAKDIVNVIACEGKDRVERHELLGKWRSRLTMAGFKPFPLSSYVNSVIRTLLGYYSDKYTLVEKDGAMLLGWKDRHLISASAWN